MKHVRIIGPLAVAAVALTVLAASAHATTITVDGKTFTGTITARSEVGSVTGHVVLDNPIAKIECNSLLSISVQSHGAGVTAKGFVPALSFTECTNSWHVTVVSGGSIEFHATGEGNATVTSSEMTLEATRFGITCRYSTGSLSSTDIGTLTGGAKIGGGFYIPATLDLSAAIPFHSGSGLCGSGATTWTGSYGVNSPGAPLLFDA